MAARFPGINARGYDRCARRTVNDPVWARMLVGVQTQVQRRSSEARAGSSLDCFGLGCAQLTGARGSAEEYVGSRFPGVSYGMPLA